MLNNIVEVAEMKTAQSANELLKTKEWVLLELFTVAGTTTYVLGRIAISQHRI